MPAIPSWLLEPLWDQFAALLPDRPVYAPSHPLGCHRPRIADRIIFEKLIQVLRFGCSYVSIADCTCGATTIRERRDQWIKAGIFAELKKIARESTTASSAWSWRTWPSTDASPKLPEAANARARVPSTAGNRA